MRSARGGRVSRGVGTTVPAGAGAFHDRVRDGTGWVRAALDHGRASPTPRSRLAWMIAPRWHAVAICRAASEKGQKCVRRRP